MIKTVCTRMSGRLCIRILGPAMAVILMLMTFAGCGAAMTQGNAEAPLATAADSGYGGERKSVAADLQDSANSNVSGTVSYDRATTSEEAPAEADSLAGGVDLTQEINNAILAERKIIRSANVTIEVENFDGAYGKISNLILGIGFIQDTNISTDRVYVDEKQKLVKRGTITIRVDKDKFDNILNNIKGIGNVFNESINGQDVTDKYIDTESRVKLLTLEESRLIEYLKKLSDLDQIFKTESRLTEIRQEIESLTGSLKKMSDLVELSTITINMNEKYPGSETPPKPVAYWQRLLNNLLDSSKGVVSFCGELIIFMVAALPVLILIGVLILLAVVIYRKIPKKSGGRYVPKAENYVQDKADKENENIDDKKGNN